MSITVVNLAQSFSSSSTTSAPATAHTTGNTLAVFVQVNNSEQGCTVSDTAGNTYVQTSVVVSNVYGQTGYWFYVLSCTGNAANVVTATPTAVTTNTAIQVYEVSGAGSFLEAKGATATSGTADSGAFSFSAQPAIILGGMAVAYAGWTAGTGFTLTHTVDGSGGYSATEYKVVSAAENAIATPSTSTSWYMNALAFGSAAPSSSSTLAQQNMPSTAVVLAASTSNIREVRLWTAAGAPKTGVVAADVTCYYRADGGTRAAKTIVTGTINTFVSLGLLKVDDTNEPGLYQFCPANADVAASGVYKYTFNGTDIFGELEVEVFASDPFAASVTAQDVADASRDDAILMLQDGYARPNVSGNMTLKDSAGATQNIAITTDVNALPIVSTT